MSERARSPGLRLEFPWRSADRAVAWLHLLLDEHSGGELHPLASFFNTGAQEKCAQVLFHRPRADVQVARDFFVVATLIIGVSSAPSVQSGGRDPLLGRSKLFAKSSLPDKVA